MKPARGGGGPADFWTWIYSSRALIYSSALSLALGIALVPSPWGPGSPRLHGILMIVGVRLFYSGVMWAQLPGYTGNMPRRELSVAHSSLEAAGLVLAVLDTEAWRYPLAASGLVHSGIYILTRALGRTPLKAPNVLVVMGLLHSSASLLLGLSEILLLSFPSLSALSLMVRVDPSVYRYKIRWPAFWALACFSAGLLTLASESPLALSLLPAPWALLMPRLGSKGIYRLGSSAAKLLSWISIPAAAFGGGLDSFHLAVMGFLGVIMGSLCAPLLLPGILGRSSPARWIPLPAALAAAAAARFLYGILGSPLLLAACSSMVAGSLAAYAIKILRGERVL